MDFQGVKGYEVEFIEDFFGRLERIKGTSGRF
jgi:hypothetical protein